MSIGDLLLRACTQTAVYWGNPQEDGYGTKTYDDPIEIPCRWESKLVLVRGLDAKGGTFDYNTAVYTLQDLDVEGVLFLGTLDDLTDSEESNPAIPDGAYVIKQFQKIPSLYSTTEFVRSAFLTQWRYR
jgi:hypothetical protein